MAGKETISAGQMFAKPKKKNKPKSKQEKFVPPDPRCERCYYWKDVTGLNQATFCCHYALENGRLRIKISKTKCGSFLGEENAPKRKLGFEDVPMTQWGCGGTNTAGKRLKNLY